MKYIYLSQADVSAIYKNLKENALYEWYITLKIIDEVQIDYTLLSKLTWCKFLDNDFIIDTSGQREKKYLISDYLKNEINEIIDLLGIENLNEKIIKTTAKSLHTHLLKKYDSIKIYRENSQKFRIDNFRDYSFDSNGVKIYSLREITLDDNLDEEHGAESFLYIAMHADKHENKRPVYYRTRFWDKKIGISKHVNKRMNALSKDKRHGGTKSPLYVKALRMWLMPSELCLKIEKELQKDLIKRNTGGEWFEDYLDDLISIVEKKIKSLIKQGYPIAKIPITIKNQDVTFMDKLDKSSWHTTKPVLVTKFEYEL
jgi:hypothetical protein